MDSCETSKTNQPDRALVTYTLTRLALKLSGSKLSRDVETDALELMIVEWTDALRGLTQADINHGLERVNQITDDYERNQCQQPGKFRSLCKVKPRMRSPTY